MLGVMSLLQSGRVHLGFLGAAEVDRFGNLNSTEVRGAKGMTRLPGSGGACDIASLAQRFVALLEHSRERLPERVSYITSPGNGDGRGLAAAGRLDSRRSGGGDHQQGGAAVRRRWRSLPRVDAPGRRSRRCVAQYRMAAAGVGRSDVDAGAECGRAQGNPRIRQRRLLDKIDGDRNAHAIANHAGLPASGGASYPAPSAAQRD